MRVRSVLVCSIALSLAGPMGADSQAQAQSAFAPVRVETAGGLKLPSFDRQFATARPRQPDQTSAGQQPRAKQTCRRGRRTWLGAILGAAASAPLAKLAYDRFENEAANGAGAASSLLVVGSAAGAIIGLSSCS
ncbi:MAG: hypothetical protein AB7N65_13840 [Vicinamibacterales bacterium]